MEVAFPGKLTLLGALPFRFLSVEENRTIMVAYVEKNEKAPWNPGEKGTLIIVKYRNNNFYNNGKKTLVCCSVISNIVRINTIVDGCPRPLASVQLACDVWEFQLCLTFPRACGFVL